MIGYYKKPVSSNESIKIGKSKKLLKVGAKHHGGHDL